MSRIQQAFLTLILISRESSFISQVSSKFCYVETDGAIMQEDIRELLVWDVTVVNSGERTQRGISDHGLLMCYYFALDGIQTESISNIYINTLFIYLFSISVLYPRGYRSWG